MLVSNMVEGIGIGMGKGRGAGVWRVCERRCVEVCDGVHVWVGGCWCCMVPRGGSRDPARR